MKKIIVDPLSHFIIIGAALFLMFSFFDKGAKTGPESIIVDHDQIKRIQAAWEKQWRRNPTNAELAKLIDEYINEEVLFREAVKLGLDKDDTIIRRRLSQKMKFLIQDIATAAAPDEIVLKKYYKVNRDNFKIPARLSFSHIYFNTDKRGAKAAPAARDLLLQLKNRDMDANGLGDPFMLHQKYTDVSQSEVSRLFGQTFAGHIFEFGPGTWQGPVRSGYGIHLVKVTQFSASAYPEFENVQKDILTEYMNEIRLKANKKAIHDLKSRYSVVIEPTPDFVTSGQDS